MPHRRKTFTFFHFGKYVNLPINPNVNIRIRNSGTNKDRKQLNTFERKVYRRILGPVCDNEKGNWRISTNKEIYAGVKILL